MDAVRMFEIHFDVTGERVGFFEGQVVEGAVRLELVEDIVIDYLDIEFSGTARIQLGKQSVEKSKTKSKSRRRRRKPDSTEVTEVTSTVEETYLNQRLTLYSRNDCGPWDLLVRAGRHQYHFRVQLPYNLPSSMVAQSGSIRYYATARLTRPWLPTASRRKEFGVRSVVDLNQLPQAVGSVTSEVVEPQSVLCCVVGSIQATWHLEKVAYVPGESITIHGHIYNSSRCKVKRSTASLVQHIRYLDPTRARYLHERRVLGSVGKGEVAPGTSDLWREKIRIPILVPPSGLKGCTLMDINYVLKIKVLPAGSLRCLESRTEIVIGSVAWAETLRNYDRAATTQAQRDAAVHSATAVEMNYFV